MSSILCFGNLQFDVLCRTVTALPPPGRLQGIDGIDFSLSGNGGNVAAVLGCLGIPVELAGYSGADLIGEQLRMTLTQLGVGVDKLLHHPNTGTGTSVITLSPDGERSILFVNGANELFDLDSVPDAWLVGNQVIVVSSIFVLPQFSSEAVEHLFARARRHGITTVLNTCWDANRQGLAFLHPILKETDYFILSYDEGRDLTGHTLPETILAELTSLTAGTVIITLGADGCCLRTDEGLLHTVPALSVEATDCTGAGDSFVAGFSAGLLKGRSALECARLGCVVASFAVTGPGAYSRMPSLSDLEQLEIV